MEVYRLEVSVLTFNRPIVELKPGQVTHQVGGVCTFNRTIVELKQKKPMEQESSTGSFYCLL